MGGFAFGRPGEIYRGTRYVVTRRTWEGLPVVVKTVRPEYPDLAGAHARLAHEHQVLVDLRLPGIVRVQALEDAEGGSALVLEDAGRQTLKESQGRRPLSTDRFLAIAIGLTEALARLHERSILHRDVNPTNVILGDDGRVTLVDFDAATATAGPAQRTGVPAHRGAALPYISPEETGRVGRLVDARADLYSLGATFYEMLTGAPPFVTNDPVELVHAHLARTPFPPAQANPAVPGLLSDLVLKLLAKMPEARYQTAEALLADLREADTRQRRQGAIARFELGLADLAHELPLPDTLYQRERERAALLSAWDRAATGDRELVAIGGPAGVGKSALAAELRGPVARRNGRLLVGKCEVRRSSTPYAPVVQALAQLATVLHSEPEEQAAATGQAMRQALGANARVITELCPALAPFVGDGAPLLSPGPVEAEHRFARAMRAFVRAVATAERPLVLLLDDLQWADAGSLRLLRVLADPPALGHLLLVATFRSEELGSQHPARLWLEALAAEGQIPVLALELPALEREAVTALCSEALRCDRGRAGPLAELVLRKTGGNPFFVRRLLRYLHKEELLRLDRDAGVWRWDLARIETLGVSDNVVDVLVAGLGRLPAAVQAAVQTAACLGNQARLGLVAALTGQSEEATAGALQVAVNDGLLVALDSEAGLPAEGASFQFVHDRVQQAAYSRLTPDERRAMHLRAGRWLLGQTAPATRGERLFLIADQFDAARPLHDPTERLGVAELNLQAAAKARASSAFSSELEYLRRGMALLPPGPASGEAPVRAVAYRLHRDALECAGLLGEHQLVVQMFQAARALASSRAEQAALYRMRAEERVSARGWLAALDFILEGLRLFGVEPPAAEPGATVAAGPAALAAQLSAAGLAEDLLERPPMRDPDLLVTMELLATALTPAFVERPGLWSFFLERLVSLTLRHGMSPASPYAFVCSGVLLQRLGDYPAGYRLARLGVDLAQRLGDPVQTCRAVGVFVSAVAPWLRPIDGCLPLLREAQAAGLAAGELTFGFSGATTAVALQYHRGLELPRVLAEIESGLHLMRTARVLAEREMLAGYQRAVHRLMGLTRERGCIEPDPENCRHKALRLGCAYLFGDLAEARALSAASDGQLASATRSVMLVEHNFWTSLTLAASCAEVDPDRRQDLLARIASNQAQLGIWAAGCPENYHHKRLLVSAEVARVEGRSFEAAELYDEAIEAATQQAFLQDEALASELAGRFHHALGRKRFARLYLHRALETYLRWGARAKAQVLEEEFPDLRLGVGPLAPVAVDGSGEDAQGAALDLLPLFRAAEAIAGEVVLSRLLGKLMDVCLATAGAERSALCLEEKGEEGEEAFVRALGSVSEGTSLLREPARSSPHVPARVIERARKSGEAVVVADASAHEELGQDAYVRAHGVRSVLAIPVVRQARLLGVLYLENNLATRVFTAERVRLLQLLTAQVAIALENSLLFEELTREIEDRERAETAVRFLAESGAALSESLDYESTLAKVARIAVSFIADWCNVDLIDRGQVQRVATAHREPAQEARLAELRQLQGEAGPQKATAAVESGRPVLITELTDEILAHFAERPEARQLIRELGASSSMVLPLIAGERRLGAITLVSTSRDRRYGPKDLALAQELARRAALAIDNAALYREAREAVRLRDEFLSIASHELNTPVASLQLLSQSIEQGDFASSGDALTTAMGIISRQSRRLATLVRELLDVSHLQGKWLQLQLQPVDLGELVTETVARFAEDLRRAGCSLTLATGPGLVGNWDRVRLDQVITNLLGNALKFAPGKQIEIATARFEGQARLVVRDHGIGIPPERLPHIFGRFERAVSAAHYGGLGLGLYIVREIVTAHGGTVRVESQPGVGSTFTVELPVVPAPVGQAI